MCPTLMWGKLCRKSLLVEVLKSDGGGLNVGFAYDEFPLRISIILLHVSSSKQQTKF